MTLEAFSPGNADCPLFVTIN